MSKNTPFYVAAVASLGILAGSVQAQDNPTSTQALLRLPGMQPPAPVSAAASPMKTALPGPLVSDFTNMPNPFDSRKGGLEGKTEIAYVLSANSNVTLTIYDLLGHKVLTWKLAAGQNGGRAGTNTFLWDGTNERGQKVSKGGYIAELEIDTASGSATAIRKIGVIH